MPFCKHILTNSSPSSGFVKKFFTVEFNICNRILEFISTLEKFSTKYEIISVLFGICSQNSPIIYNAALLAFKSDMELIKSKVIFLIKFKAVLLYFRIKSLATMIHSGIASSLLLSMILLMQFTHSS